MIESVDESYRRYRLEAPVQRSAWAALSRAADECYEGAALRYRMRLMFWQICPRDYVTEEPRSGFYHMLGRS